MTLPRVLVIDDLFGSAVAERRNLCKAYRLLDTTGDDASPLAISIPVAEAVFCSGQRLAAGVAENSVDVALDAVQRGWPASDGSRWALCLLDLRFVSGAALGDGTRAGKPGDDKFGLEVLRVLCQQVPELPVVILSSRERSEVIEECRRLGASDFIQRHAEAATEPPYAILSQKLGQFGLIEDSTGVIVGRSLALLSALASARRAATGVGCILLLGESGSGKELFAQYIHQHGLNPEGHYKVFHAFGTAEALQEDLLFGHERGAFTGAARERAGLFEETNGGTLFIDEVGDVSEGLQNRLLRPIEAHVVSRQGSTKDIPVSSQLVLATNKALDDYARTGKFKGDLLNRINAYTIKLPPLRERQEDIPLLANRLLEKLCADNGARWPREIAPEAMHELVAREWKDGNVRELRNVLERVVKNNKDAEIVVAADLGVRPSQAPVGHKLLSPHVAADAIPAPDSAGQVPVASYEGLFGSWPELQSGVAMQLADQLVQALAVTARRDARDGSAKVNLAGAVGCLLGRKITTIEAADFVKRIWKFDEAVVNEFCDKYPLLRDAVGQAVKSRRPINLKQADSGIDRQ